MTQAPAADPAVRTSGLIKRFKTTMALDGVDLEVRRGSVLGLLGPNGAGKTTAVRILTTLLRPDGGRAEVAGFDVVREAGLVRRCIGLVGQTPAVDEVLSGRQNLVMFGRLFHLSRRAAESRADALLADFDLADVGSKPISKYSGGMRRRLDLATSLILAPDVLFLDEPTTGLDPRGRNEVWASIRALVRSGTTVVLTTQYLDEADQLADGICVMDAGRVIAEGTPDALKSQIGGDRIDVVVSQASDLPVTSTVVARAAQAQPEVDADARRVSAPVTERLPVMTAVLRDLAAEGISPEDISLRRPTLDEVFMQLTGHRADRPESTTGTKEEAAA